MLSRASGMPENGTTAANAMNTTAATATADRVCAGVGGRSVSHLSALAAPSRAITLTPPADWSPQAILGKANEVVETHIGFVDGPPRRS